MKSKCLLDIITLSTDFLAKNQIDNPRLNAELLIGYALKMSRVQLYLNYEKPLTTTDVDVIREYLKRRGQHEPVAYITGEAEFFSLSFKVNSATLIPRPETEILVEEVIKNCNPDEQTLILDIGTGSGNIAISIAHERKKALILAIDIEPTALEIATENANQHQVNDRIRFSQMDLFDPGIVTKFKTKFNIIVSNPPYIPEHEYQQLPTEVKNYEPKRALSGGEDGLNYYRRIAEIAPPILMDNGILAMEMSYNKDSEIVKLLSAAHFQKIEIIKDLNRINRVVLATKP